MVSSSQATILLMSKPIKFKTAMITIRALYAPIRTQCVEDPRNPQLCSVFVGQESIASITGDSWDEVIEQIMVKRAAAAQVGMELGQTIS